MPDPIDEKKAADEAREKVPAVQYWTDLYQQELDSGFAEATQHMAKEWLNVEQALEGEILNLATSLLSKDPLKLTPVDELIAQLQAAGYSPEAISQILADQGLLDVVAPDDYEISKKEIKQWQLAEMKRYASLMRQTQDQITKYGAKTASTVIDDLQTNSAFSGFESAFTNMQVSASRSGLDVVSLTFNRLNTGAVENIVAIARAGKPLAALLEAAYPLSANGITRLLIEGTALGRNPRDTARRAINEGLAQGLNHMLLVARDQQVRAFRESGRRQYEESGLIESYTRLAAKSDRTCMACLALDGTIYNTSELMALHPEDRCSMIPNLKGLSPITFQTGEEWFARQPESVQRKMMGKGAYAAWKNGEFDFGQLVTVKDNPTWGPSSQVTPLYALKNGQGGFRAPRIKPKFERPFPNLAVAVPGQPDLPQLDHDILRDVDLHLAADWGPPALDWKQQSYGGLIFDDKGRVLLRKPTGDFDGYAWTFPKGRKEARADNPVDVALREVEEESGIDGAIIGTVPGGYKSSKHSTNNNFFLMKASGFDKSKMDDETSDLTWVDFDKAQELIKTGTNKGGIKRDLAILEAGFKQFGALQAGEPVNDGLFEKHKKPVPTILTDINGAAKKEVLSQAKGKADTGLIDNIGKKKHKGLAVLDHNNKLMGLASYDDTDSKYITSHGAWGKVAVNEKTTLLNLGKIAAKQGKGIKVNYDPAHDSSLEKQAQALGFEIGGPGKEFGAGTLYLYPEWMKEWKKKPTAFAKSKPKPPTAPVAAKKAVKVESSTPVDSFGKKYDPESVVKNGAGLGKGLKSMMAKAHHKVDGGSIDSTPKPVGYPADDWLSFVDSAKKGESIWFADEKTSKVKAGIAWEEKDGAMIVKDIVSESKLHAAFALSEAAQQAIDKKLDFIVPDKFDSYLGGIEPDSTPALPTYTRSAIPSGDATKIKTPTGLDSLASKGFTATLDKIKAGQKGFHYLDADGKNGGIISYEEQATIIKVGAAGFSDFDVNKQGLSDVIKVAKAQGKDFVSFAPKGAISDQYAKWGFDVNQVYDNGTSYKLPKSDFDAWLKDPEKYGEDKAKLPPKPKPATPAPSSPAPARRRTTKHPTFRATPKIKPEKPIPDPKPLPPPPANFPKDPKKLTVVKSLGGSTGAQLVKDDKGKLFVRKTGNNVGHIRTEAHADAAFAAAGANVPKFAIYDTDSGPVKLAEFIEGEELGAVLRKGGPRADAARREAQKFFAVDAVFGNRDSIGASYDNMLVDANGKVWRIDNGGSFQYRAQGELKSDWDEYPLELWSMRDKGVNPQTSDVYGGMNFYDMADQIIDMERRRDEILAAVPEDVQEVLAKRMKHAHDLATTAKIMEPDDVAASYADDFAQQRLQIRSRGIQERMPQALGSPYSNSSADIIRGNGNPRDIYDENGDQFDNLRGSGSLTSDVKAYIDSIGGDYSIIEQWSRGQGYDSWNSEPQAVKYFVTKEMMPDKPADNWFWKYGESQAKSNYDGWVSKVGEEKFKKTILAYHAFTQEMLEKTNFQFKDDDTGTVLLMRTENRDVTRLNGLKKGDREINIPRGPVESTSIFRGVTVFGSEMTLQRVPFHRILGAYFVDRNERGESLFLGDGENEFVAILGKDLAFDYAASVSDSTPKITHETVSPYRPPRRSRTTAPTGPATFDTKTIKDLKQHSGKGLKSETNPNLDTMLQKAKLGPDYKGGVDAWGDAIIEMSKSSLGFISESAAGVPKGVIAYQMTPTGVKITALTGETPEIANHLIAKVAKATKKPVTVPAELLP